MNLISLASLQAPGVSTTNLKVAQDNANSSIARLSSGNAITRAKDDVAGMSISTRLQTRITSIRSSLVNTLQASSMLQVADGGLSQIDEILNRMKALSTQANSGGLTDNERGFLNLEFQELKEEINHISSSTNFNGVTVLKTDNVQATNSLRTDDSVAEKASAIINFISNPDNNDFFEIQNVRFRFRNAPGTNPLYVQRGATTEETVNNLLAKINSFPDNNNANVRVRERDVRLQEATYELISPTSFRIESISGGELARNFMIDEIGSNGGRDHFEVLQGINAYPVTTIANAPGSFILNSNDLSGLSMNDTQAVGQTDGSLIQLQDQKAGEFRVNFTGIPANNNQLRIDNGYGGEQVFIFRTAIAATDVNADIRFLIGSTIEETIDNVVIKLNEFTENQRVGFRRTPVTRQLEYFREGTDLVMRYKGMGNATDINELTAEFRETGTTMQLPDGTSQDFMTNGVNEGFDAQGVINPDFYGKLEGFEAEFLSRDKIKLSVTVGESTYVSDIQTDFPSRGSKIKFVSDEGGYFDITFNQGAYSIDDQDDADNFAGRIQESLSGLTFYQTRNIDSFGAGGIFEGSKLEIRLDDFDAPLAFQDVKVVGIEENKRSNITGASIEMTISGERFRNVTEITDYISPYQPIILESIDNSERRVIFTNSRDSIQISSFDEAAAIEKAFFEQLPKGESNSGVETVSFEIDGGINAQIDYDIETTSADTLFEDDALNIGTVEAAIEASKAIDKAIDIVTSRRAYVGALQSRADYTYSTLESAAVTHESARGRIADTDISTETTAFAQSQVQIQSSIAVTAQSNVLRSTVLDIVDAGMVDQNFLVSLTPKI